MALKTFSLVVFICFLSFADAEYCDPEGDAKQAEVCGQEELCITINEEVMKSYNYSKAMDVTIECHYRGTLRDDFLLHWKKGEDVISNEEKCRNLEKVIQLSSDTNNTVYTCEKYSNNKSSLPIDNITAAIKFLYISDVSDYNNTNKDDQMTAENINLLNRLKSFCVTYWIVLAAGLVLFIAVIVIIVIICVVFKSKKSHKDDKKFRNAKGSKENLEDIPKDQTKTPLEPKLNEFYTDLNADGTSELYCDPYTATYIQLTPKSARKPKPEVNYSNTNGLVYDEPSTYNIAINARRIHNNLTKNNAATYNNFDKSSKIIGATYNNFDKSFKNTGVTYNNFDKGSKNTAVTYNDFDKISKNTGVIYNTFDKSSKNNESIQIYDNMAASYYNTGNGKYTSDVYSDPAGFYEVPS